MRWLLDSGGSPLIKNNRGESAIDVVSSSWSQPLSDLYSGIGKVIGLEWDLDHIQQTRPLVAKTLQDHVANGKLELCRTLED